MLKKQGEATSLPENVVEFFEQRMLTGFVSTVRSDGALAVVPVGVVIHEGKLRVSSPTNTRKIANLKQNPQVALCMPDSKDPLRYIMVRGKADLEDDNSRKFITWIARTHLGFDEYPYEPRTVLRTVITIRPERFSMPAVQGRKSKI